MQFWIIYGGWGVVPVQSLSDELLEKKKINNVHVWLAANCQNWHADSGVYQTCLIVKLAPWSCSRKCHPKYVWRSVRYTVICTNLSSYCVTKISNRIVENYPEWMQYSGHFPQLKDRWVTQVCHNFLNIWSLHDFFFLSRKFRLANQVCFSFVLLDPVVLCENWASFKQWIM